MSPSSGVLTWTEGQKCGCVSVGERRTCFVCGGVRRHTPRAGLAAFGYHDGKLVHGVGLEAGDGVAERGGVCRLEHTTQEENGCQDGVSPCTCVYV